MIPLKLWFKNLNEDLITRVASTALLSYVEQNSEATDDDIKRVVTEAIAHFNLPEDILNDVVLIMTQYVREEM